MIARHINHLLPRKDGPRPIKGVLCHLFTRDQFKENGIAHLVRVCERKREMRDGLISSQGELLC